MVGTRQTFVEWTVHRCFATSNVSVCIEGDFKGKVLQPVIHCKSQKPDVITCRLLGAQDSWFSGCFTHSSLFTFDRYHLQGPILFPVVSIDRTPPTNTEPSIPPQDCVLTNHPGGWRNQDYFFNKRIQTKTPSSCDGEFLQNSQRCILRPTIRRDKGPDRG